MITLLNFKITISVNSRSILEFNVSHALETGCLRWAVVTWKIGHDVMLKLRELAIPICIPHKKIRNAFPFLMHSLISYCISIIVEFRETFNTVMVIPRIG